MLKEISTVRHDLELAEQERDTLEQLVTYCSLTYTDSTRELKGLTELSGISNDRVEGLARRLTELMDLAHKGFNINDGPFVKQLLVTLDSIGVHRQKYYGSIFVGNHIHKMLQVSIT